MFIYKLLHIRNKHKIQRFKFHYTDSQNLADKTAVATTQHNTLLREIDIDIIMRYYSVEVAVNMMLVVLHGALATTSNNNNAEYMQLVPSLFVAYVMCGIIKSYIDLT